MDFIIETLVEMVVEIILDGTWELMTVKKIPMFIRVLVAGLLLALYIGFGGILIYIGIKNNSMVVTVCAVVLLVVAWVVAVRKYKEIRG